MHKIIFVLINTLIFYVYFRWTISGQSILLGRFIVIYNFLFI
jgi:hypothetical protein